MGTRSTIKFKETKNSEPLLCVYRQYDGYFSGAGKEYAEWLKDFTIVNGFNSEQKNGKYANGISCLALQFVANFKKEIGNFYATTSDDIQEYNYEVWLENNELKISCDYYDKHIEGNIEEFINLIENEE